MNNDDNIITLQTFFDPMLAHITRARLEDAGIHCFISDEDTAYSFNQTLGKIKLKIFERDLEKCKAILAEDVDLPDDFTANDQ